MEDTYFDYDYSGVTEEATQAATPFALNDVALLVAIIGISLLLVVAVTMTVIILVKLSKLQKRVTAISVKMGNMENVSKEKEIGVVFCKKCGSQYNVTDKACPYCGAKR